jgi:hypothetical protein
MFADPMMKDQIDNYIANNYASFDVQFQVHILYTLKAFSYSHLHCVLLFKKRFAKGLKFFVCEIEFTQNHTKLVGE